MSKFPLKFFQKAGHFRGPKMQKPAWPLNGPQSHG